MLGGAEDITLIDLYKEHMDAVRDNGLLFKDHNGRARRKRLQDRLHADEVGLVDILIVLVKSTHTKSALAGAKCCIGENTVVVSLQNGLGNDISR